MIPTYNRLNRLGASLESVLAQSFDDFEVIIVDDGSEDGTLDWLANVQDSRVRVLQHDCNRGAAAARNTGVRGARGQIIAFQDSDDIWAPSKLQQQIAALQSARGQLHVIYCQLLRTWDNKTHNIPRSSIKTVDGDISKEILSFSFVGTPTMLLPKACLEAVGGFDEDLACLEDWELNIRLAQKYKYKLVAEPFVKAELQPNSMSRNNSITSSALDMIHKAHADTFRNHPYADAKLYARRGHYAILDGRQSVGRSLLRKAMEVQPTYPTSLALFCLSFLGRSVYESADRIRQAGTVF